jgi:hypothetical protein
MFPFWDRASEERAAEKLAAEHQAREHEAAVQRIVEQAHEGDEIPQSAAESDDPPTRSLLEEMAAQPGSDLERIADGVYRGPKAP